MIVFFLPGKQLFEKDHNLDTSDIQFLEDGNNSLISLFLFFFLCVIFIINITQKMYSYMHMRILDVVVYLYQKIP